MLGYWARLTNRVRIKTPIRTDQRTIPKATVRNSHLILYPSLSFGERASFSEFYRTYWSKEAMPYWLFTVRMPYSLNNGLSLQN